MLQVCIDFRGCQRSCVRDSFLLMILLICFLPSFHIQRSAQSFPGFGDANLLAFSSAPHNYHDTVADVLVFAIPCVHFPENQIRSSSRLNLGVKPAKWWVTSSGADGDLTSSATVMSQISSKSGRPRSVASIVSEGSKAGDTDHLSCNEEEGKEPERKGRTLHCRGRRPDLAGRWERNFEMLLQFRKQSGGHDCVCKKENLKLFQWIASQR